MSKLELVTASSRQRLPVPAASLVAVQVVHAVLPGPAEGGGSVVGWGRRDVGWIQWLPVLAAIVVGIWCVAAGADRQTGDRA